MVLCKLTIPKQVSDLSYSIGKLVVYLHMSDSLNPSPSKKRRKKNAPQPPSPYSLADNGHYHILHVDQRPLYREAGDGLHKWQYLVPRTGKST